MYGYDTLLGWSTFPWDYANNDPRVDSISIKYSTLPGGSLEDYNEGKVSVAALFGFCHPDVIHHRPWCMRSVTGLVFTIRSKVDAMVTATTLMILRLSTTVPLAVLLVATRAPGMVLILFTTSWTIPSISTCPQRCYFPGFLIWIEMQVYEAVY